jgi:hypothetical protein
MKSLSGKTLAIVHASLISSKSVQPFIDEILPEVTVVHHVDDTIQKTKVPVYNSGRTGFNKVGEILESL